MAESEDEDDFPNDFDGLDFDNVPGLQAPQIHRDALEAPNAVASTSASPAPSTGSCGVEDLDPTFLAAVDALEARALSDLPSDATTSHKSPQGEQETRLDQVHNNSMKPPESSSMNRKGKRKAEPSEDLDVRAILAGYETEATCPICCDLLVGAQVSNPCGHTCCGECGYGWLAQNEYEPTCAVCRSSLCPRAPLLPNFAVDNFVRHHLQALARSGRPEWQEKGYRTIEWNKRLESWKKQTDARAAKKKLKEAGRPRRRQQRYYEVDDYPYVPPWLVDEGIESDEPLVPRVLPHRATRSRR